MYRGRICWVSSKLITRIISLGSSLLGATTLSRRTPPKFGWNTDGSLFSAENLQYLWNGAKSDQGYYWWPIGNRTCAFDWCQNQWPWMTLKGHYALCFKTHASFGAHHKILIKIDPYYQRRRCSPMTLVFGNIRFMRIFEGVPWSGGVQRQWGIRKHQFSGLSDVTFRHLRKWGQHYYIVLFNPLSPFHYPQNTTLNSHFTLNFHYYEQLLNNYFAYLPFSLFIPTVDLTGWPRLYHVTSGDVRKRTVICRIYLGSA